MNDAGGLRRLGSIPQRPLSHFVWSGREETPEIERLAHGHDDFGEGRFGVESLALFFGCCFAVKVRQALFEADRDWYYRVALRVCLDPFSDLGEVLVLLANVILFAEVDEEDDGLGGEQEKRVDDLDLTGSQYGVARRR